MKRNKISLSRNKPYNNLNLYLSSSRKDEKKSTFKTTQDDSRTIPKMMNKCLRDLSKKEINIIFSVKNYDKYIKKKYNNDYSRFLLMDDPDSKLTSPISNTIRYNHSIQRFKHNNFTIRKYKASTSYSGYGHNLVKLNKPHLLKLLDKQIIDKALKLKDSSIKSLSPTSASTLNNYFLKQTNLNESNNFTINENFKANNNNYLLTKPDKIYNLKELYKYHSNEYANLIKSFKKLKKQKITFPLEFPNSISFDKMELRDKVKLDYFKDENIKRKIRKTLYYELNSFDYDNGNYSEYKNSIQKFINFIYDINIIPHIKNKFIYNKPISKQTQINEFYFSRNVIRKEVAAALNRYIINNIRKEKLEKEETKKREKKLKELSKSNKIILKLYFEEKDDGLPDLTSEEIVEISDYFGKTTDYKSVNIAKDKLKSVVFDANNFFNKKKMS